MCYELNSSTYYLLWCVSINININDGNIKILSCEGCPRRRDEGVGGEAQPTVLQHGHGCLCEKRPREGCITGVQFHEGWMYEGLGNTRLPTLILSDFIL